MGTYDNLHTQRGKRIAKEFDDSGDAHRAVRRLILWLDEINAALESLGKMGPDQQ